ncbi:hypothetical protein Jden_1421 [Jonesia denitrificans DSM 20603]|uniref:Uncharacterized protein n=2 Tax=Jonesia TaxID=43673 RepID=C7R4L6_JONDD|nr:hypothetical protein Jden_1421 [Jonesia denitrificans DSM 20603]SQH21225.1 Uncharacterised protein [Jonesia denitrificans]
MNLAGIGASSWCVWILAAVITGLLGSWHSGAAMALGLLLGAFAFAVGRSQRRIVLATITMSCLIIAFRLAFTLIFPGSTTQTGWGLPPISLGFVTLFGYITSTTLLQALQGATSLILLVVASGTLAALVPPGQWVTLLPRSPGTVTTLITVSSALARTLAHHIPNAHLIHRIRPHAPRKQLLVSLTDILLSESVTLAAALSRARHPHTRQQQRKATLLVFLFLTTATMTMTSVLLHSPTLTTVSAFLLTLTTISMWRTAHKGTTALRRQHITWRDATMWSAALIMATGSLSHHTPGIGALSMTLVLTPLVIARKDTHAYLS